MTEKKDEVVLEIQNDDGLLRGVPPQQWNYEEGRPHTAALNTDELSTDWEKYRTVDEFMSRHQRAEMGHGLLRFKAEFPRRHNLNVQFDPRPPEDPENEAHTLVLGKKPKAFFKAVKKTTGDVELIRAATKV